MGPDFVAHASSGVEYASLSRYSCSTRLIQYSVKHCEKYINR